MFINKRKYELEKQRLETRIDQLEWVICKGKHEYEKVKSEIVADGNGYGDLYHDVYICKKCGKVIK